MKKPEWSVFHFFFSVSRFSFFIFNF